MQPQPIIREKHEVNEACRSSTKEDEVKVVITLTNRKELEQPKLNARKNKKRGKKLKIEDDEKNERTKAKSFKEEKNKMNSEAKMNNVVSFVSFSRNFLFSYITFMTYLVIFCFF